jgi:hypothetical protein
MPVFIFLHSKQEALVTRGERLGGWKRILLWFGFPVSFQAMASEDVYYLTQRSISYHQSFSDAELRLRMDRQKSAQAAEVRRNPNPGTEPKRVTPKGK